MVSAFAPNLYANPVRIVSGTGFKSPVKVKDGEFAFKNPAPKENLLDGFNKIPASTAKAES